MSNQIYYQVGFHMQGICLGMLEASTASQTHRLNIK